MKLSELIKNAQREVYPEHAPSYVTARLHECVKPLEWEVFDHQTAWAHSVLGVYRYDAGALTLSTQKNYIGDGAGNWRMATIEAAKAAAQAHYAEQIIAGLDL